MEGVFGKLLKIPDQPAEMKMKVTSKVVIVHLGFP